jgi:hypothetical protein
MKNCWRRLKKLASNLSRPVVLSSSLREKDATCRDVPSTNMTEMTRLTEDLRWKGRCQYVTWRFKRNKPSCNCAKYQVSEKNNWYPPSVLLSLEEVPEYVLVEAYYPDLEKGMLIRIIQGADEITGVRGASGRDMAASDVRRCSIQFL